MPRLRLTLIIVVLVAIAALILAFALNMRGDRQDSPTAVPTASTSATAITPTAAQSSVASPSAPPEEPSASPSASATPTPTTDTRTVVEPFVSNAIYDADAGSITVFAFVPGLSETKGTCTATLSDGSSQASASSEATLEVATTTCAPITFTAKSAPSANATVSVKFDSELSTGTSQTVEVTR